MRFSPQGDALHVRAPAKINLSLNILGDRPDGFHDLCTEMVSIGLMDELRFSPMDDSQIVLQLVSRSAAASALPVDDRNLVVRAARLLQTEAGISHGVRIKLWKRIPTEAGLGGGSSDAAATLMGLNRFWKVNLSSKRLHGLAATLGSDVNFFLDSVPAAICTGRGETIQPVPLPYRLHVVLIKPPTGLPTGKVFHAWEEQQHISPRTTRTDEPLRDSNKLPTGGACPAWIHQKLWNDLEGPAATLNGEIRGTLERLRQLDVMGSGMTGSGSACFALCRTVRQARVVAGRCRQWNVGQVFVVSSGV